VIRRDHRIEIAEIARKHETVLADAARGVADAVHALVPGCTAAVVVVGMGSEWKMLAQCGPVDLSCFWRRVVATTARVAAPSSGPDDAIVAPFASVRIRAVLALVPLAGTSVPPGTRRIVQPLLDAGGILLDATFSVESTPPRAALRLVPESRPPSSPGCPAPGRSAAASSAGD
jgi:hypothetical protein